MESFEYSIGHSNDSNFNILQPDFLPETDFETLLSAIQCETKDPNDILCVDSECIHFTNACMALPLPPQLYEHNEAIDGVGIDIDIDNGNDAGIGCYDGMDPNLYDHNEAIDDIGIDFDISSGSGSGTCNANDIGNGMGFYDEMDPNLYDHNEAIDGVGINIDNGTNSGIGCYEEMDPNLYLIWDEEEDDVKGSGDDDSSETMTTPNPTTKRRSGGGVKGDRTKSLISERKRRIGMKEKLYTLLAVLKALESITSFQIQSSNLATVGDTLVLTFTLKVAACEFDKKRPPNLKILLSGAFLKQGFKFKTVASP
nr:Myc-type, basic helix-loop-helix (bHLH) domain-containing protein [Tanacetum cinerariifolium]